jgi:hypothetical protein
MLSKTAKLVLIAVSRDHNRQLTLYLFASFAFEIRIINAPRNFGDAFRKRYVLFVRLSIESAYANTTEKSSLYKSKTFHHCSIIIFISFLDIFEGLFTYPPNLLKKISKG